MTASLLGLTLITACASTGVNLPPRGPAEVQATVATEGTPDAFRDLPPPPAGNSAQWWQAFSDPILDQLVREGLEESLTVQQAQLRIIEARNLGRTTIAGFAPQASVSASTSTDVAISGQGLFPANTFSGGTEDTQTTGSGGPRASWELPLFGRLNSAIIGADAQVRAAELDLEAARIALIADLASAYVSLRTAQVRIAYLQEDIERAERLDRIAADRYRVGLVSRAEAAFTRSQLAATRAQLPDATLAERTALDAIAVLRGVMPGTLDGLLVSPDNIASYVLATDVPDLTSVPADLLRRRPDVLRAEQNAILQGTAVGVARAEFYPSVSITGAITTLAAIAGNPLPETLTRGNIGTAISLPLYDFGRRRANLAVQTARFDQALASYRGTALGAVREGQAALASYTQGQQRVAAAIESEEAARERFAAAEVAFREGLTSLQELTEAQTALSQARQNRLTSQLQVSDASVGLYRAFAGSPGI